MARSAQLKAAGAMAAVAAGVWAWLTFWPSDERAIRRQLDELAAGVNEGTTEGLGTVARAARIGGYFTEDVVVELGQGTAPIHGRETLMGIAARLPPHAGAHTLAFEDVAIDARPDVGTAAVTCAVTLSRRNESTGERTVDAREVQMDMRKIDGVWRIARVTAVDVLRRE